MANIIRSEEVDDKLVAVVDGHPLAQLYREVRSLRFVEGASDLLRLNVAKGRLELGKGRL